MKNLFQHDFQPKLNNKLARQKTTRKGEAETVEQYCKRFLPQHRLNTCSKLLQVTFFTAAADDDKRKETQKKRF